VELEPVAVATTVVSQDIWLVPAQAQLDQVAFLVPAVVLVLLVEGLEADLLLVVDLLADPVRLLATSAVDQTISLAIARLKP